MKERTRHGKREDAEVAGDSVGDESGVFRGTTPSAARALDALAERGNSS